MTQRITFDRDAAAQAFFERFGKTPPPVRLAVDKSRYLKLGDKLMTVVAHPGQAKDPHCYPLTRELPLHSLPHDWVIPAVSIRDYCGNALTMASHVQEALDEHLKHVQVIIEPPTHEMVQEGLLVRLLLETQEDLARVSFAKVVIRVPKLHYASRAKGELPISLMLSPADVCYIWSAAAKPTSSFRQFF